MTEREREVNNHAISVSFTCHNATEQAICLICSQGRSTSGLEAIQDRWSTSLITTRQHFSCGNSQQLRDEVKFSGCSNAAILCCRLLFWWEVSQKEHLENNGMAFYTGKPFPDLKKKKKGISLHNVLCINREPAVCRFILFLERDKIHKVVLIDRSDFWWRICMALLDHIAECQSPLASHFHLWRMVGTMRFTNSMFNKGLEGDRDKQILDTFKWRFLKIAIQLELGITVAGSSTMPLGTVLSTNTESWADTHCTGGTGRFIALCYAGKQSQNAKKEGKRSV